MPKRRGIPATFAFAFHLPRLQSAYAMSLARTRTRMRSLTVQKEAERLS